MKLSRILAFAGLCSLLLSCGSQPTTSSPADFVDGVAAALENGGDVDLAAFQWTREPAAFSIDGKTLTVTKRLAEMRGVFGCGPRALGSRVLSSNSLPNVVEQNHFVVLKKVFTFASRL